MAQLASAPGLGPGGRGFKSHHPDQTSLLTEASSGRPFIIYEPVRRSSPQANVGGCSIMAIILLRRGYGGQVPALL